MELKDKKVLITGGSAGIGKAIIKELIKHGVKDIAVVARKQEPLTLLKSELNAVNIIDIQADISVIEDLNKVVSVISREWGMVDILINSAGVVSAGLLAEQSDEDVVGQIDINVTGLILLTKKTLPYLQKSKEGAIINVSSGYGYIAMPFYSVYAATKAAVAQFSDAMRRELYQYPIHVMTVYPSATDTGMMKTAVVTQMDSPEKVAQATVSGIIEKQINVILGGKEMEEKVKLNFLEPEKIDQFAADNFENLRKRTKNHRSM
ncbi:SDR family oxidoreductase [Chryseobacterium sp. NKUCC03_KSP]|uniref:SDR family NAD(P)-dependent oxidoreductase n=1 Tax=Chryseobacterium sp. NKUCC03_KSP TaxID=2842125 RepID=UPI001C5ADCA3|nr:SDR family NAD(P)-dependent oxidoreductase [Chryseobacterium sp. NKUCC03_KSP]MBW3523871.1 SDR family NAD(P)-dependent oxidoreductase [Chryseobacterium sp. NKUCC03_KSP]